MSVLVLHTTESDAGTAQSVAAFLRSRGYESHTVFDPATGEHVRLLPWSTPAKSLRNLAGGVETNRRGGVYQVEVVGRAADVGHYSDDWYRRLAEYVRRCCAETGTPLVFPHRFVSYPKSYGLHAPQRLDPAAWLTVSGVIGHQHVPESDHGDPGDLNRLIDLVTPPRVPAERKRMFQFGDGGNVYLWDGEKVVNLGGLPTAHVNLNSTGVAPFIGHLPPGEAAELVKRLGAT